MFSDIPRPQASEGEYPFWDHPEQWPHDPPGYLFLARACHEVGRALFGPQWAESWGEPGEPPDDRDLATWKQYGRECDECQKACVANRAEVVRMIAEQCAKGILVAAVRPKAGGEMVRLEQHLWNLEDVERRFQRCDMSGDNPLEVGGSYGPDWIFIERSSLDGVLSGPHQNAALLQDPPAPSNGLAPNNNDFNGRRDHRKRGAQKALLDIYGPNSSGLGDIEDVCLQRVNEWLTKHGKLTVSAATLRRAKQELRTTTNPERS